MTPVAKARNPKGGLLSSNMSEPLNTRFDSDDEEGRCTPSPEAKKRKLSPSPCMPSDVLKGSEADYGDFVLDRTESVSLDNDDVAVLESSSTNGDSLTWWDSRARGQSTPQIKNNGCFNCDGNHHLNECPEPKDFKKIRQRQTEMRNRNSNTPRYHFDGPPSEKKFRAGRISDDLRNALGIGRNDIPEYIYRMRRMGFINGYPPGYLKKYKAEANMQPTILLRAIERDDSNEILKFHMVDESASETAETNERPDSPPPTINADKMIYYCGFNQYYRDLRDKRSIKRMRRKWKKGKDYVKEWRDVLEEGEIIILDPPPPPPPALSGDDDDCIIIDCEPRKTPSPPVADDDTPKGCSMGVIVGTPVLMRRRGIGEGDVVEESKPALENFSKGIVPFEAHEEDTPHKGFLKKIMGKLKKFASSSH
ncbi:hypothetical protein ANCCEY_08637 [Ancylostoma ceylanicum]|uniref:PSP proline-rich domain-containing protein n=1 Tax=Ancylostoma ceylanicum TaxID=53326 RepID=A0A0D6LM87_9BILA|nr:hypothetical protein ANCCEY_08637 [Ancylostoma ceylanicum]